MSLVTLTRMFLVIFSASAWPQRALYDYPSFPSLVRFSSDFFSSAKPRIIKQNQTMLFLGSWKTKPTSQNITCTYPPRPTSLNTQKPCIIRITQNPRQESVAFRILSHASRRRRRRTARIIRCRHSSKPESCLRACMSKHLHLLQYLLQNRTRLSLLSW